MQRRTVKRFEGFVEKELCYTWEIIQEEVGSFAILVNGEHSCSGHSIEMALMEMLESMKSFISYEECKSITIKGC